MTTKRHFLYLGAVIPFFFFGTTLICGFVQGHYNHLSRMVSELGTIGTRTQFLFTAGLLLCAVLSILFVIGLFAACRSNSLSPIPVALILTYSFSIAGAALFPLPLRLHGLLGSPSILLILSPLTALILWRTRPRPRHLVSISLLSLLVMSLGFSAFLPDLFPDLIGLKQRFFHLGWSIWFIYLTYGFLSLQLS
jgi:hypothetical membrane protein